MEAARYQPHYTIADYERWPGEWELWHGTAVSMSPSPTHGHQRILFEIARLFGNQLHETDACRCHVVGEHDWRIDGDTVLKPDIMVVCGEVAGDYVEAPPTLIVEVFSPSTALKDRNAKRAKYAEQGVKFYVMVDPDDGSADALELRDGEYEALPATKGAYQFQLHNGCVIDLPQTVKI